MLKQTSATAEPVAPRPRPSMTVPSASTSKAVGFSVAQGGVDAAVIVAMAALLKGCALQSVRRTILRSKPRAAAISQPARASFSNVRRCPKPLRTFGRRALEFSSCKAQYIGEGARAVNDATSAGAIYFVEQYQRFAGRRRIALGFRHGYCPSHSKEEASCAAKSPNP
ncbi:hypothetical protein BQ8482_180280 [Mesorhizobium delmotii]|uniref:Uncharacterized protein n=1 Tax=Mesorhizobium delmotii TaxID=1631247 RepID=A0A2P9AIU1_9HYPH|nr:hypothetical protein BQ8482_180280 [Mesorhizobium delmotii]